MDTDLIFKALSNPMRRQILQWLKHPEQYFESHGYGLIEDRQVYGVCAGQFDLISPLSQSTMSNHLSVLQQADLICVHKRGQWSYFSRNESVIQQYIQYLSDTL